MIKFTPFYLFLIATVFVFNSCGLIIKSTIRKDDENVPPDFGKEKTTLLVVSKKNSYNIKVDKIFKNHYTGEYMFIKPEELEGKYKDTVSYRYVISDHVDTYQTAPMLVTDASGRQHFSSSSAASRSFQVTDRKTKKVYGPGVSSGTSWKKILKVYVRKLDSERKNNGPN